MDISELTQKSQMEAILGPDSKEPFETFMSDLTEKRSEAESMFNLMKHQDPISLALKLAEFLGSSKYVESPEKYTVLLRKLLAEDDLVAFLYRCITDSSSSNKLKQSAFLIFSRLAKDIGQAVVPGVKDLRSIFRNTLNDDTIDLDVRIAATNAVISFILCISSLNEKQIFQELLPGVMGTLTDAILTSSGKAKEVLKLLIELAENDPRFLRTQLVVVVGSMFEIAEDDNLAEETRHLAVEFLLTLVEAKKRAPGMMKRVPLFISRCFAVLLKLLVDVNEDDLAWHTAHRADPLLERSGTSHNGKRCLARFSVALGGKSIAHIAKEQCFAYLESPEWEKRHAALIALTHVVLKCSKGMSKNLEQLVSMVFNCFQDSHPRVRWAACCVIGGMSVAMRPDFQEQCHNEIFPALAATLGDFQNPPMQDCGMTALYHFSLPCKPEYLMPYLDDILSKLLLLLQSDKQFLQRQALTALAYVANCVKEHLRTYYDMIMPQLIIILRNADMKSNFILRAATLECISICWLNVGMENSKEDTKQVMDMLISSEGLQVKTDDTTTICMLFACVRFCECMEKDFLPYMGTILPFFIQCAQLEPVMTISVADYYKNYVLGDNRIEKFENLKEKQRVLDTKSKACEHLYLSIKVLEEEFYLWIPQAFSVFVPLLKFYTGNEVRKHAVRAMAHLLWSAKLAVKKGIAQGGSESYFAKLSGDIMKSMVEALREERETEVCAIILDELDNCLQICGPSLITEGHVCSIVNELKHVITKSSSRKQELVERAKMEDFDAEEEELLRKEREEEEQIDKNVGQILCTLIIDFKGAFLPFLGEWSSYLLPMWSKEKTTGERGTSMLIFAVLMEEWPGPALKYYDVYLPLILDASNDEVPSIRRRALYGLELWAEYDSFIPFIGAALSRINVVITHINALEHENVHAYVNAVSALGKICEYHGKSINLAQVIPAWLNCLPIKADSDDFELIHKQFCLMVERYDKEFLGPNHQNLPKVISIFAEVLCSAEDEGSKEDEGSEEDEVLEEDGVSAEDGGSKADEVSAEDGGSKGDEVLEENEGSEEDKVSEEDEEILDRIIDVLRHLQKILPPNTLESACSYLLPQHEMVLKSCLSLEEDADF